MITPEQVKEKRERWKKSPAAFRADLLDTLYDHLILTDDLARDPGLEPKDRLRALADFVSSAEKAIEALSGETKEDESLEYSPKRTRKRR